MKLNLIGNIQDFSKGIEILFDELGVKSSSSGIPVYIKQQNGPIIVKYNGTYGEIAYDEKIHFFRALGLWLQEYGEKERFEVTEYPQFKSNGVMVDVSRNGVLKVDSIKKLLRIMALMGLNMLMLYTEDTYTVEKYPYFGYMRGRYSKEELKECDDYAALFGIEMIPCIQTLAHLTEALKWNYAANIRDTSDILLVGEEETYTFIEELIKSASEPFRSQRIHIGMDEAHQLGLGKYLERHGYRKRFDIMNEHLQRVTQITEKYNLKPMIWSDMYFRLGSKTGGYYDLQAEIPEDVIKTIPKNVQLVYWDYYHTDVEFYERFIQKHKEFGSIPIFAGGVWTWNGIAPNYGKAIRTTNAALEACKREGLTEVFATIWGDNGAETNPFAALVGLQLFAEHGYARTVDEEKLRKRFSFCTGGDMDDFLLLNQFDETPGVEKDNLHESHPSKFLLWQDVLIGLYDENIKGLPMAKHYQNLAQQLKIAKKRNEKWELLFSFYIKLAEVLKVKSEIGIRLKDAYDSNDRDRMKELLQTLSGLQESVNELRTLHRELWYHAHKPFGWEVLDIRYGGVFVRLDTARFRIKQWLAGEIETIEELEEERLYFDAPWKMPEGALGRNSYHRIVTAGAFSN